MVTIKFNGQEFTSKFPNTIVESAAEAGIDIPYGCLSGSCHACEVLDVKSGNLLLACCTIPTEDMEIKRF